jgi:hypothetical protein
VKRTKVFWQPSGSDEGAGAIMLRGSQKRLRAETTRPPAAPPPMAIGGGAFLSKQVNDNRVRYYKMVEMLLQPLQLRRVHCPVSRSRCS